MGEVIPFPLIQRPAPIEPEPYGDNWISVGEAARRVMAKMKVVARPRPDDER